MLTEARDNPADNPGKITEFQRLKKDFGWRIEDHAVLTQGIWTTGRKDAISYPDEGNALCAAVEEQSFWFRYRNRVIESLLRKTRWPEALWEVGSGNGFVANHLRQAGMDVVATEPGQAGAQRAAERGISQSVCGFIEDLKLPNNSIPAIGCFDVLEHLKKPESLLKEFSRIVAPGGIVAVSVPALQGLWSQTDEIAGHYRRYSRRAANHMMRDSGFEELKSVYMMACMAAPLFLLRSLPYRLGRRQTNAQCLAEAAAQLAPRQTGVSALARAVLNVEIRFAAIFPLPFGTSVVGVYSKK